MSYQTNYCRHLIIFIILGGTLVHKSRSFPEHDHEHDHDHSIESVHKLFDDFWDWYLHEFPEKTRELQLEEPLNELGNYSLARFDVRYNNVSLFLEKANHYNPSHEGCQKNLEAFIYHMQTYKDGYHFNGHLTPLNNFITSGQSPLEMMPNMPTETESDFNKILHRMRKIPKKLTQIRNLMKKGMELGITNHADAMNKVPGMMDPYIIDKPEDSPLYKPFRNMTHLVRPKSLAFRSTARSLITMISDSYLAMKNFLENVYETRPNIGLSSLPGGQNRYQACIRYHTSLNLTAQEIHDIGLQELEKTQLKIKKEMQKLGYKNESLQDIFKKLRDDPSNFYETPNELVEACEDIINNKIEPKIKKLFHTLPKKSVKVKGSSSPTAMAYYSDAPLDGSRDGTFIIGTSSTKLWAKYSLMSLALHETWPGHHLQIEYLRGTNLPKFRKYSDTSMNHFATTPSSFPTYGAYKEGWAMYAETLGFDLNLYKNPLDRVGHYIQDLLRCVRLVIDTGIHALDWDKQKATDYMLENTSFSKIFVETQLNRYITWPGQALSYKIGQMKISGLRRKAEKALGTSFNIKDFHRVVLDNPGSLATLEMIIDNWIAEQRKLLTRKQKEKQENSSGSAFHRSSLFLIPGFVIVFYSIEFSL